MKKLLLTVSLLVITSIGFCAEKFDEINWDPLRVNQLLPGLASVPSVDFALPKDYICVPSSEIEAFKQFKFGEIYFWGPEEVIAETFKDFEKISRGELTPKVPLLHAEISWGAAQISESEFSIEKEIKDMPGVTSEKLKWGEYPVLALRIDLGELDPSKKGKVFHKALVGLNYASNVLEIKLIPSIESAEESLEFWNTFLKQTQPLGIIESCKSQGQELKVGVTTRNLQGSFLKIIAEQRTSDGEIQVAVIPCSEGIRFKPKSIECISALQTGLASEFQGNLVKVNGEMITEGPKAKYNINSFETVNVLVKEVNEFSLKDDGSASQEGIRFISFKEGSQTPSK